MENREQNSNKYKVYEIYEREKKKIIEKNLPSCEYEEEIAKLIEKLEI